MLLLVGTRTMILNVNSCALVTFTIFEGREKSTFRSTTKIIHIFWCNNRLTKRNLVNNYKFYNFITIL